MMDSAVQRAAAIGGERLAEHRGTRDQTTARRRDKRPQCAARSGCCFYWLFEQPQQCLLFQRNVCAEIKPLSGQETPHNARLGHDTGR